MLVVRSRGLLLRAQRLIAIIVIWVYTIVSLEAALVLVAVPPIHLLGGYREEFHRSGRRTAEAK